MEEAAGGAGGLVWVSGDAGIGKTRLLAEAGRLATATGVRVLTGRGWEDPGTPPYWIWTQVLRDALPGADPAQVQARWGPRVREALRLLPELGLGRAAELGPDASRFSLFDSVVAILAALSGESPLLLVLDDLHWTDPGSLRLLEFLEPRLATLPVLAVGAWRDHEVDPGSELGLAAGALVSRAESMSLPGLGARSVADLVESVGGFRVGEDRARRIAALTGGNPLFVSELSRLARDRGDEAGERMVDAVPASAQAIIRRRLGRVSQSCHELLSAVALAGPRAGFDLIGRVLGRDPGDVVGELDEAVAAGLAAVEEGRVVLAHPLVRSALVAELPAARARRLHLDLAHLLEPALAAEPLLAAEVAEHLVAALPLGSAEEATAMGLRAAQNAAAATAYEEAAAHYARHLQLAGPGSPHRLTLLIGYGEVLLSLGDVDGARRTHLAAADLARSTGDAAGLARSALAFSAGLSGFEVRLWDQTQIDLIDEALVALPEADSAVRADLLARLSVAVSFTDRQQQRPALAELAVAMARRAGAPLTVARALAAWCDAYAGPDDAERRERAADEIVATARGSGERGLELLGLRLRVVAHLEQGRRREASADMRSFERAAEALGQPLFAWYVPLWHGFDALLAGDLPAVERLSTEAARIGRQAESRNAETLAFVQGIWSAVADLRGAAKMAELSHLFEVDAELGELSPDGGLMLGLFPGQPDHVRRAACERIDALLAALPVDAEYVSSLCHAAYSLWEADEDARFARPLYDALLPHAHRFVVDGIAAGSHGSAERLLGALATLGGDHEVAEGHFQRALAANRDFGDRLDAAHTRWMYGEMLRRRGGPGDAERSVTELAAAADEYAAMGIASRAAMVAEQLEGRGPAVPATAPGTGVFRRDGDLWRAVFRGREVGLRPLKGYADLAVLLALPGREVHVLDLAGARAQVTGDAGEVIDPQARAAYRRRLEELEDDLTEADRRGDVDAADRARTEKEFLVAELTAAYGLGGRARRAGDPAERARTTVTWRIREAIKRIDEGHPELAGHLRASVRTGVFCCYEPEQPHRWET